MEQSYFLPPLGKIEPGDYSMVCSYLTQIATEAAEGRSLHLAMADDGQEIFAYGVKQADYDEDKIVVNEIATAICANVDSQTKEAIKATLEPEETGDPGEVYWGGPPLIGMEWGLLPMNAAGVEPVDDLTAERLESLVESAQLPERWVTRVDDKCVAEVTQKVHDVLWRRSKVDRWLRRNLLTNGIQGFAFGLYEWDNVQKKHVLRNISLRQIYIDPTVEEIDDAAYVGIDAVFDASEAKKLFPDIADKIQEIATPGQPVRGDGSFAFGSAFERNFGRPTITLRIFWLCNQPIPIDADEAIGSGLLEARDQVQDPDAPGIFKRAAQAIGVMSPDEPTSTQAFYLAGSDKEVTPDHASWPARLVTRQITTIVQGALVVDDKECEHGIVPILHNVNIPLSYKPYGIGEPFRLGGLQKSRSRTLNALTDHAEYFGAPLVGVSESTFEHLPEEIKEGGIEPNLLLVFPDDLLVATGGKPFIVQDPPQTPPALIEVQQILHNEINEQGGNTDARRGQLPASNSSGRTVALLQEAGNAQASFRAKGTEEVVERITRLSINAIFNFMTVADIAKIVSKYPRHILEKIIERGREAEWNIEIIVPGGSGSLLNQKKQEALTLFNTKDPLTGEPVITLRSLREIFRIDHQKERKRWQGELRDAQPPMPVGASGAPGEGPQQPGQPGMSAGDAANQKDRKPNPASGAPPRTGTPQGAATAAT